MTKGYLPPNGPQNEHRVPHTYRENQGAHKLGQSVIYSPPDVILTAAESAQRQAEMFGLEQVPDQVAQEALEAYREDDTETVASIIAAYHEGELSDAPSDDGEQPEIPENLDDVGYRELQDLAKAHNITATQSAEELQVALNAAREDE